MQESSNHPTNQGVLLFMGLQGGRRGIHGLKTLRRIIGLCKAEVLSGESAINMALRWHVHTHTHMLGTFAKLGSLHQSSKTTVNQVQTSMPMI